MTNSSNDIPTKLLWLDMEMTGLDPAKDLVLEVAVEVTDFNFKTIASYEARISQPRDKVVKLMARGTFWRDHQDRDDFLDNLDNGKSPKEVESDLLELIDQHFGNEPVILSGNSIHNDRKFIASTWPELDLKLHYRMLDVSSFKIVMQAKYGVIYEKSEPHRAFEDIQASIAELEYYLDWFKKNADT